MCEDRPASPLVVVGKVLNELSLLLSG